jgi:hypothetical protein
MGRASSTNLERGMRIGYWWESQMERPERKWVEKLKWILKEIGWDGMDWIDLAHDRDL